MSNPQYDAKSFVHTFDGWQVYDADTQGYVDVDFASQEMKIEFAFFIACRTAKQFERA